MKKQWKVRRFLYSTAWVLLFGTQWPGFVWAGQGAVHPRPGSEAQIPLSDTLWTRSDLDFNAGYLVTGQVAGGKHFHGLVPYRRPDQFYGALGSTTLDTFRRTTQGAGDGSGLFFSQTRTLSTDPMHGMSDSRGTSSYGTSQVFSRSLTHTETPMNAWILDKPVLSEPELPTEKIATVPLIQQEDRSVPQAWTQGARLSDASPLSFSNAQHHDRDVTGRSIQDPAVSEDVSDPVVAIPDGRGSDRKMDFIERLLESRESERSEAEPHGQDLPEMPGKIPPYPWEIEDQDPGVSEQTFSGPQESLPVFKLDGPFGSHHTPRGDSGRSPRDERMIRDGWSCLRTGQVEQALNLFTQAIHQVPRDVSAGIGYSMTLLRDGQISYSALMLRRTLSLPDGHQCLKVNVVDALGGREAATSILDLLEAYLKHIDHENLWILKAYLYNGLKDFSMAQNAMERVRSRIALDHGLYALSQSIANGYGQP